MMTKRATIFLIASASFHVTSAHATSMTSTDDEIGCMAMVLALPQLTSLTGIDKSDSVDTCNFDLHLLDENQLF